MATLGESIAKILTRMEEIEKKIDVLAETTDIKLDLSSRDATF